VASYKTIKLSLKHVLQNEELNLPKIESAVIMVNDIVTHGLQFLKLFLLEEYKTILENNDGTPFSKLEIKLPLLNTKLFMNCFKEVCGGKSVNRGKSPSGDTLLLIQRLNQTSIRYSPCILNTKLNFNKLSGSLEYESINSITDYTNNIIMNYTEYVKSLVRNLWLNLWINNTAGKSLKFVLENKEIHKTQAHLISQDLCTFNPDNFKSYPEHHSWNS